MNKQLKPIGLRLAEKNRNRDVHSSIENLFCNMIYDPKEEINKIRSKNKYVPAIFSRSNLVTETFTRIARENTDSDHHQGNFESFLATETVTEIRNENTDQD